MAQESKAESGKRFARDMMRVRESRNISVDDLHDETKIPIGLIQAFEETALFDHPQFNRVYLRSFVRTYANVLGIDPEIALESLEEALSERYSGSLAVEFLGAEPPEPDVTEQKAPSDEPEEAVDVEESVAEEPEKKKTPPVPVDVSHEEEEEGVSEDAEEPREEAAREDHAGPTLVSTTGEGAVDDPSLQEADEEWSVQSPPSPKKRAGRSAYRERPGGADWRWVVGIASVLIVGVVVWIVVSVSGNGSSHGQEVAGAGDTASTAADTVGMTDEPPTQAGPVPTFGDTIDVNIVAETGKLDPVRVTVDDDLRRPYWAEQGDSLTFHPTNRIVIEELLDNIRLNIEGYAYPTNRRDERGRIVITRDSLQAYFASNRPPLE